MRRDFCITNGAQNGLGQYSLYVICITNGPYPATNDPEKGYKRTQKLISPENLRDRVKNRANHPFFNDFPVPQDAWDKGRTTAGHGTTRFRISDFVLFRDVSAFHGTDL